MSAEEKPQCIQLTFDDIINPSLYPEPDANEPPAHHWTD